MLLDICNTDVRPNVDVNTRKCITRSIPPKQETTLCSNVIKAHHVTCNLRSRELRGRWGVVIR
jgi:hypothetical protein